MRATVEKLSEDRARNVRHQSACAELIRVLHDRSLPEQSVFDAMSTFVDGCWFTPTFRPIDTTFRDIASTGNLDLIRDEKIRDGIISLYDGYADATRGIAIDQDWVLPNDARLTYEHEVLHWGSDVKSPRPTSRPRARPSVASRSRCVRPATCSSRSRPRWQGSN